ncbi:hypothetical protein BJF89_07650 [Corynebacterium sp. CNJ-954]|uniref:hypothetical protein n=1 Tax=Corynebacterium sp. CNJ-954 TaxID=1904962 RepID=UPI000961B881|nr:hypothetical protein [Corynebacterium sp. CNJ-954]OLT51556.1 hypothetical protein BJF89_07650 [Corynebacterium sp. CNJ-954]
MSPVRDVTGTRRRKLLPAAGLAAVTAAGLFLTACDTDGAGVEEAQGSGGAVTADPDDAAVSNSMTSEQGPAGDGEKESAPQPTPGAAPVEDGGPAPDPAPEPQAPPEGTAPQQNHVELADYTVPLNGQDTMICMFRESQEADGFDWGCQAENFHAGWDATRGGDANGVAYRAGGDPELYALLGNVAGVNNAGGLEDGSVTSVGDRFVVDLTQPDAALITADGVTTRVTAGSYDIVG